jgi:hypothetical protein
MPSQWDGGAEEDRMFKVGDRVRCVDGRFSFNAMEFATHFPVTGADYTIRAVASQAHYLTRVLGPAVWLEEIWNAPSEGPEPSFSASRFRRLEEMGEANRHAVPEHVTAAE